MVKKNKEKKQDNIAYQMPEQDKKGLYVTENEEQPPRGLFLLANGELWEIKKGDVKKLEEKNIKPSTTVKHGEFGELPLWRVDKGKEHYMEYTTSGGYPHVNSCVLTAIDGFLQMMGMGKLTSGDADWFKGHEKIDSDGVPRSAVLGVAHGLVSVYPGLGIDRVYLPSGSPISGELKKFADVLGVNPLAMLDRFTTNSDFAHTISGSDNDKETMETIAKMYRMEFVENPPTPCIVMISKEYTSMSKKNDARTHAIGNVSDAWSAVTQGMGHAEFLGPRDELDDEWTIAFTIGRDVQYSDPSAMAGYSEVGQKEKESAHKIRNLSIWQSEIGGQKLAGQSYSGGATTKTIPWNSTSVKELDIPIVTTSKDAGNFLSIDEYFSEALDPSEDAVTTENCPDCGGLLSQAADILYCNSCGYFVYEDLDHIFSDGGAIEDMIDRVDRFCIFCGADMVDKKCTSCVFSSEQFTVSTVYMCDIHKKALFLFTGPYTGYVCIECIAENNETLEEFIGRGGSHHSKIIPVGGL